jgi:predicted lipoprotein with Yx(FWY)xxD motif
VYLWVADTGDKSTCSGACATAWPPVEAKGKPTAGNGANAADLGTTTRSDGSEQVTYKGHPLYYFIADKSPGQTSGQGSDSFGAKWWLVAPSGVAITSG